jgi:hypothetical protein
MTLLSRLRTWYGQRNLQYRATLSTGSTPWEQLDAAQASWSTSIEGNTLYARPSSDAEAMEAVESAALVALLLCYSPAATALARVVMVDESFNGEVFGLYVIA